VNLESFAYLAEIVGAIAVVVSLIYLAVQVRQSNRAQSTENYARALERFAQFQANLTHNAEFAIIFSKGVEDLRSLEPWQRLRVVWSMHETFDCFEFLFQSARVGTVPAEVWERWSAATAWWLSYPGIQQWWASKPIPYTRSFSAFVEEIIANNPTPDDVAARWRRFIESGYSQ